MAIDALRDGFVKLCFDPSANILGDACRLVVEGPMLPTGTATVDELYKVSSFTDINAQFGEGSRLAEALKLALDCYSGAGIELMALPRAQGGANAAYEMTITGPATSDGRVDIFWGDSRWNISALVTSGMSATDIGNAIVAEVDASFPYNVTNTAGLIRVISKQGGVEGNYIVPQINWHGRNNYLPDGVTFSSWTQTVVGTDSVTPLDYSSILGECCVCGFALLYTNPTLQTNLADYLDSTWDCETPQCFGHGYTYDAGTLGQILAKDTNDVTLSRLAHCDITPGNEGDPVFPWMKVMAYAMRSVALTLDNPELSIQGPNFGVLDCVRHPESCSSCLTYQEQEQLRATGFVVTVPVSGGEGALTSPMVTNDITNNRFDIDGRENFTFRSVSARRLAVETASQIADELQKFNGLGYFSDGTNIAEGTQGVNRRVMLGQMRAWAKSQVGVLFSEFPNLDEDLTFRDDFEVSPQCQGVPGKLYMDLIYRPPVRVREVSVRAAPRLLDNC